MEHCFFYLVLYGVLLGLLSAGYASYHLLSSPVPAPGRAIFAHMTAALTSGRPVFGFVGWCIINALDARISPSMLRNSALAASTSVRNFASMLRQPLLDVADETPAAAPSESDRQQFASTAESQGVDRKSVV